MKTILEKSRYLAFIGIVSLLVAALAAFAWGTLRTFHAVMLVIESLGADAAITIEFIEIVDSFLIATAILIFAVSLYELFIGDINLPEWMLAHNFTRLEGQTQQHGGAGHGRQVPAKAGGLQGCGGPPARGPVHCGGFSGIDRLRIFRKERLT
jgi:hypothetical protein